MTSEKRGRPRRSSTRALEEAAAELFLEQGYSHTTVDDISSRAGVSRATFFNYFHNKSDVLWVDVDRALVYLSQSVMEASHLGRALELLAHDVAPQAVPLIASQFEAMEADLDLRGDGGQRVIQLAAIVAQAGVSPRDVWMVTGALVSAALEWSGAGVSRAALGKYLREHLERIRSVVDAGSAASLF